jgi:hypothetical protein
MFLDVCSVIRTLSQVSQLLQIAKARFEPTGGWKRALACWHQLTFLAAENPIALAAFTE